MTTDRSTASSATVELLRVATLGSEGAEHRSFLQLSFTHHGNR
jgi:hypothetical protein